MCGLLNQFQKPTAHWPNVVMIISDRLNELNLDKFVGFFDNSVSDSQKGSYSQEL